MIPWPRHLLAAGFRERGGLTSGIKHLIKETPLMDAYIARLLARFDVPRTFIENAFFVRRDLMSVDDHELRPEHAFREKYFPDGSRPSQQFEKIKDLPYVDVSKIASGRPNQ